MVGVALHGRKAAVGAEIGGPAEVDVSRTPQCREAQSDGGRREPGPAEGRREHVLSQPELSPRNAARTLRKGMRVSWPAGVPIIPEPRTVVTMKRRSRGDEG
jgi:hypothetical protein